MEWESDGFLFSDGAKILRDLKKPFKLEGFTRIDETPVHKAVREALLEVVCRIYFMCGRTKDGWNRLLKSNIDRIELY